jgi:hypothetical protein
MDRFSPQLRIAEEFGIERMISETDKQYETNTFLPSIGAEVEVHWRTLLPDYTTWFAEGGYSSFSAQKKKEFSRHCAVLQKQLTPAYERTKKAGIPKDIDGFWEFAHRPAQWYGTLASEIEILFSSNLIRTGYDNPLHITVAGLKPYTKTSGILASTVEFLGGTTSQRLLSPAIQGKTWNSKGKNGLRSREKRQLQGKNYAYGTEFATLVAQDAKQVTQTLRNAQLLCWAAITTHIPASQIWSQVRNHMTHSLLRPHDLNRWWQQPEDNASDWQRFATLMTSSDYAPLKQELNYLVDTLEELAKDHMSNSYTSAFLGLKRIDSSSL